MSVGYGTFPGQRRRWPAVVAVVAALVLAAGGAVLGRVTADDSAQVPTGQGSGPCPAARSEDGAVKAAVCYEALLYRLEGLPEDQARSQLRAAVANPASVDRLATLASRGVPQGGRAAAGVVTVHLDDYSQDSAQVFVWVAVARSAKPGSGDSDAGSVTQAAWNTDAVVVDWVAGRWGLGDVSRQDTAPPSGNPNLDPTWSGAPYAPR